MGKGKIFILIKIGGAKIEVVAEKTIGPHQGL